MVSSDESVKSEQPAPERKSPCVFATTPAETPPLTGFTPSRKRHIGPTLMTAASQRQPNGFALSPLLPTAIILMGAHVWCDRNLNPFETLLRGAIQTFGWRNARACANAPGRLIAKRAKNQCALRDFDCVSAPLTERWKADLPRRTPSGCINSALIEILANHTGYRDVNLARDLSPSMPVGGLVPFANVLTKRPRPASVSFGHYRAAIPGRSAAGIRRMEISDGAPLARQRTDLAIHEVERRRSPTPIRATADALKSMQLNPRFAISEKNGASGRKVRLFGDFNAVGINYFLHHVETAIPDSLYTSLDMAAMNAWAHSGPKLLGCTADSPHAYEHVGIHSSQMEFSTISFANPDGVVSMETMRGQPLGSRIDLPIVRALRLSSSGSCVPCSTPGRRSMSITAIPPNRPPPTIRPCPAPRLSLSCWACWIHPRCVFYRRSFYSAARNCASARTVFRYHYHPPRWPNILQPWGAICPETPCLLPKKRRSGGDWRISSN